MKIIGNPPFQNREKKGKTQHKIWIEFTKKVITMMGDGDTLMWIIPQSWGSPSNKVLKLMKQNDLRYVNFDTGTYFPGVGSTFSDFLLVKTKYSGETAVIKDGKNLKIDFSKLLYCPGDINTTSLSIHNKIIFSQKNKLPVKYDYVKCHNVLIKDCTTLSREKTDKHIHPIFHTNSQVWYSSIKQDFSADKKVMWTRSGYTKPFYDKGVYGVTDMGYYSPVSSDDQGELIADILNSKVFSYIFTTAKWSGFGNELVFTSLPDVRNMKEFSFTYICEYFGLTDDEKDYILNFSSKKMLANTNGEKIVKSQERSDNLGEVFTPAQKVDMMLAPLNSEEILDTFVDPSCGNGNMVIQVIKNKIQKGSTVMQAVSSTYGCDIMADNVDECRRRILYLVRDAGEDVSNYIKIVKNNVKRLDFFTLNSFGDIVK